MNRISSRRSALSCTHCLRLTIRSYNVSKLSPIQPHPPTSPQSHLFVPRKLGQTTRLSTYYDELIAPNLLLLTYDPSTKRPKQLLPLRWDGTSPYHKNRAQPRESPLPRLVHVPNAKNLPQITAITIHSMVSSSIVKRPDLLNAAVAVQSITGQRPDFVESYSNVAVLNLRPRITLMQLDLCRYSNCCQNNFEGSCNVKFPIHFSGNSSSASQGF
jgi:hypothetical protein